MASSFALVGAAILLAAGLLAGGAAAEGNVARSSGSIAYPGQFPWHAAIITKTAGTGSSFNIESDLLGSGALISKSLVLTSGSAVGLASVDVLLGAAWLTKDGGGGTRVEVTRTIFNAAWNINTAENDIALLQLKTTVELSDTIAIIRLPPTYFRGATYVDQTLSVTSWGVSDEFNNQGFLSVYNVDVIRNLDCQSHQTDPSLTLPWTKMCVVGAAAVPCQGDKGDPAVFLEEDGVYTLVGIVSSDTRCSADKPSTLTRVTEVLDWLQKNSDAIIE